VSERHDTGNLIADVAVAARLQAVAIRRKWLAAQRRFMKFEITRPSLICSRGP